ncbi:MAG: hypothetical protein ACK5NN_05110, partial [Sphingomonadaceae bacterium]
LHRAEEDGADPLSSETEQDQPDYFPASSGQMVAPDMPEPEQDMADYAPIPFTREASRNIRDAASIEAGGDSENTVSAPSVPSLPKPDSLPIALRPLDIEEEAEENDAAEDLANLSLNIDSRPRLFGSPVDPGANGLDGTFDAGIAQAAVIGEAASAIEPEQTNEPDQENALENGQESESEAEEGYSSLLDMKSRLKQAAGRDFVRIEDEELSGDENSSEDLGPRPLVIFPGQKGMSASPASDGPSRAPADEETSAAPRPFDSPVEHRSALSSPGFEAIDGHAGTVRQDRDETERALREALEKLNRMSGAA